MYNQRNTNLLNVGKACLLLTIGIMEYNLRHLLRINGTVYGHLTFILRVESVPHKTALHLEALCLLKCCKCLYTYGSAASRKSSETFKLWVQ